MTSYRWPRGARGGVLTLAAATALLGVAACSESSGPSGPRTDPLVAREVLLEPSSLHLGRGDVVGFTITVKGADGRQIDGRDVRITSDDESVAVPGSQGYVIARGAGATNVRVTVDNVTRALPVNVVNADTAFELTEFNGSALPVFLIADSVEWDGVKEYHELYVERGTLVLSGLHQLRYKVDIKITEYNVITENGRVRREVRRVGGEFDRGIIDVAANRGLAMTSEYISPLAHTADVLSDGYLVHFRIPGDDTIWNVKYRRVAP